MPTPPCTCFGRPAGFGPGSPWDVGKSCRAAADPAERPLEVPGLGSRPCLLVVHEESNPGGCVRGVRHVDRPHVKYGVERELLSFHLATPATSRDAEPRYDGSAGWA